MAEQEVFQVLQFFLDVVQVFFFAECLEEPAHIDDPDAVIPVDHDVVQV
jgi:hypothetical protein